MASPFHRGDFKRIRRSITIAVLELEGLEPRMLLAYKRGLIPSDVAADLSLARLMAVELDGLLRGALDRSLADTGRYYDVYADASFQRKGLVA
jgi:hypothetical protein